MALLLRDRDAPSEVVPTPPAGDAPVTVVDFACESCGAGMKPGQDWCLECGTAAPGRLGARPGWRSALTVVSVTLLLVVGSVVASYAALTSDAERKAAAPSAGDGQPIAAAGPATTVPGAPITPGATGPGTTPPAGLPPAAGTPPAAGGLPLSSLKPPAGGKPIIPVTPRPPATNTPVKPVKPVKPAPPAAATPPPATGSQSAQSTAPKPEVIRLRADAATTYDPAKRAGAEFGPGANAVDASPQTVWDVTVPADGKPIGAGLLIDLGKPYALRAIKIATPTKGFELEVYGAVSAKQTPVDILDKRWEHLTDLKSVTDGKLVSLLGKSKRKQQLVLLYVTMPADATDPRVAIGKVTLAGTP